MSELKRSLGAFGLASIGIGAIIGAGIFVLLGVASGLAGPAVTVSFIIAGTTAFLTAMSSAELSSFITEAGGSYIYTHKAFGPFWGFLVGWMKSFDYIVGASAVSVGFAAYFASFTGLPATRSFVTIVAATLPLLLMLLNLKGIKEASGTNSVLVALKVSALALFIIVGGYWFASSGDFSNYYPFFPTGMAGVFSGATIIFFAFIGFNTVTVMSEEVKDPERNVPRAIILAFGICTVLYIGVSLVSVGLVNWRTIGQSSEPLEVAMKAATNNILVLQYLSISALFATASVVMASILGGSRALFAMARKHVVPSLLSKISKQGVPTHTVMLSGFAIAAIVVASRSDLNLLASVFNFGTLMTFLFINLSLVQLRRKMPHIRRAFTVPFYPVTTIAAIVSCLILALYLNLNAIIVAGGWLAVGVVAYEYNMKRDTIGGNRRRRNRAYLIADPKADILTTKKV